MNLSVRILAFNRIQLKQLRCMSQCEAETAAKMQLKLQSHNAHRTRRAHIYGSFRCCAHFVQCTSTQNYAHSCNSPSFIVVVFGFFANRFIVGHGNKKCYVIVTCSRREKKLGKKVLSFHTNEIEQISAFTMLKLN